ANLAGANLSHTDLSRANLGDTNLKGANLKGAYLSHAKLSHANLTDADLSGATLRFADFRYANLSHANLGNAYLRGIDFRFAKLICTNLRGADLRNANLIRADLKGARYDDTILEMQCPEQGSFIAWKKLINEDIAKLLIPEDAKRSSSTSRKCRASKAKVLAIYNESGEEIREGRSIHDYGFIYWVGEMVYPDYWDEERWVECSNGIHFFMTREEAEEY
ncbi:MAG: pentapeptide repeat-containing protein, partial [Chloroflexi bacterium]|nr:pentapeptide repeat-containing protein [Chloroflexota bacterium]